MKVIVCGGRDFADRDAMWNALDEFHRSRDIRLLIHGAARGADILSGQWAIDRNGLNEGVLPPVVVRSFPAEWNGPDGKRAGFVRNQKMLDFLVGHAARVIGGYPGQMDVAVIGFPGGNGTKDMLARAAMKGVEIWTPGWEFNLKQHLAEWRG